MLPNISRPCSSSIEYLRLVVSLLTPHRFPGLCASLPRTCQPSGQQGGIHKAGDILRGCSQLPDLCKVSSEPLRNQSQNTKTRARSPDSLSSIHLQYNEARPEAGVCRQLGPADRGHCSGTPSSRRRRGCCSARGSGLGPRSPSPATQSATWSPTRASPLPSGTRLEPRLGREPGGGQRTEAEPGRSGRRGPPDS